jgi:hypothetical protein
MVARGRASRRKTNGDGRPAFSRQFVKARNLFRILGVIRSLVARAAVRQTFNWLKLRPMATQLIAENLARGTQ